MKKILIIEDEKLLADMYQDIFIQSGYKTFLAPTAEDGIKLAKREKPDLILLDILLPKDNGIDFLKKLKTDPQISSSKVIAFSNYEEPKTVREAYDLGVKDYLLKTDFNPKEIVERVERYL